MPDPKDYAQIWLEGGGDPSFDQIDGFLQAHFGARAVRDGEGPPAPIELGRLVYALAGWGPADPSALREFAERVIERYTSQPAAERGRPLTRAGAALLERIQTLGHDRTSREYWRRLIEDVELNAQEEIGRVLVERTREVNELRTGLRILQERWPATIPAPMDAPRENRKIEGREP